MLTTPIKLHQISLISKSAFFLFALALLLTILCVFVPFSPVMPSAGLDQSWALAMNQAVAEHLEFGKQLIFTFGPYASIYTKTYGPATDFMMLAGSAYVATSYWLALLLLMDRARWHWCIAYCLVLAAIKYMPDAFLLSYPLVVALVCFKVMDSENNYWATTKTALPTIAILFAPFGLLGLIKGSLIICCGAIAVLCCVFMLSRNKKYLALACLVSPLLSSVLFWLFSGQSIWELPNYVISMVRVISGYTAAMATDGIHNEILYYLVTSVILLLALWRQKIAIKSKIFLQCVYFIFLFISFKEGFVRHDGHAVIAGTSILLASLLLPSIVSPEAAIALILFSIIPWSLIDSHYINTSTAGILNNLHSTYSNAWAGIKERLDEKNPLKSEYESAMEKIRQQTSFPTLPGTTDIYSYDQSYLLASGNTWSPRPVIQSYSAYTPKLAEINREHLIGNGAPENIIFSVEPIDYRLPSLEDGASWQEIIENYRPSRILDKYLLLHKVGSSASKPLDAGSGAYSLGETVQVPTVGKMLFARIDVRQTLWGILANLFFKPSPLQIHLQLANGVEKYYRFIPGMAKSGFLVSPFVEDTTGFELLYEGNHYTDGNRVISFSIEPVGGKSIQWNKTFVSSFYTIDSQSLPIELSFLKFDKLLPNLSRHSITKAAKCDGSIDSINDISPASERVSTSGILKISGWLALSATRALLPNNVVMVLTDSKGKRTFFNTHEIARPDVGAYYKQPVLNGAGYESTADISMLKGEYRLGLGVLIGREIQICEQFSIPVTVKK